MIDFLPVFRRRNRPLTDAVALLDMIVQARTETLGKHSGGTFLQSVYLVQQIHDLIDRSRVAVRAEIFTALFFYLPGFQKPRIGLLHGDFDIGVGLVIPEQNIVLGTVFFDEIAFQNQGFHFAARRNIFKLLNLGNHGPHFRVHMARGLKILAYPIFQRNGLAHVNYLPQFILMKINSRRIREFF